MEIVTGLPLSEMLNQALCDNAGKVVLAWRVYHVPERLTEKVREQVKTAVSLRSSIIRSLEAKGKYSVATPYEASHHEFKEGPFPLVYFEGSLHQLVELR